MDGPTAPLSILAYDDDDDGMNADMYYGHPESYSMTPRHHSPIAMEVDNDEKQPNPNHSPAPLSKDKVPYFITEPPSYPIHSNQVLSLPGPSSLPSISVPSLLQLPPPAPLRSLAGFNRFHGHPLISNKTRWIIQNTNGINQFDVVNAVDVPWIINPEYHLLNIISHGQLVVSDQTQLRLHLWRAQYPNVPQWFLGVRCLSRGLDWRVFVSTQDLVPHPHPPIHRPAYLHARHSGLVVSNQVFVMYESWVRDRLLRPYACHFLTMGSIVWRIALYYGPPSLFSAALAGPSTNAYMHHHIDHMGTHFDNKVTDDDIALLLGVTNQGSLWPPLDIWHRCQRWKGEWSHDSEGWFQDRIGKIQSGEGTLILNRAGWNWTIRQHTAVKFDDPNVDGSMAQVKHLCNQIDQLYPPAESYTALV
ncbi:hypothetical protein DFH29DRAFT_1006121 [Suillus ampliporus]|nr:hypothetical protein DFH29DRAFT_1006121 [Suillus ampliporus]